MIVCIFLFCVIQISLLVMIYQKLCSFNGKEVIITKKAPTERITVPRKRFPEKASM